MSDDQDDADSMLTVKEVAELIRFKISSVYRLCEQGLIRHYKIGSRVRILRSDFDQWLQQQKIDAKENT